MQKSANQFVVNERGSLSELQNQFTELSIIFWFRTETRIERQQKEKFKTKKYIPLLLFRSVFATEVYFPQKLPLVTLAHSRRVFLAATDSPESLGIILCLRDAISARDVDGFPWSVIGNTDPKYITCGPLELAASTGEDADVMLRVFTLYSRPVCGVNGHTW